MEHTMLKHDLRILVVEDHPFQLAATQCLLNSYGFHHLTATHDAETALLLMRQYPLKCFQMIFQRWKKKRKFWRILLKMFM